MLPFCGYNMTDYFGHWLSFAQNHDEAKLPKIFYVDWFLKGEDGRRGLWPGFGDNSRVLEWAFNRVVDDADAVAIRRLATCRRWTLLTSLAST